MKGFSFIRFIAAVAVVSASTWMGGCGASGRERSDAITGMDLSLVQDGVYAGESLEYVGSVIKVEVTVRDHSITGIRVTEARDDPYVETAKGVIGDVLEEQSLEVDAVTGATVTSKAILRAVGNALEEGKRK